MICPVCNQTQMEIASFILEKTNEEVTTPIAVCTHCYSKAFRIVGLVRSISNIRFPNPVVRLYMLPSENLLIKFMFSINSCSGHLNLYDLITPAEFLEVGDSFLANNICKNVLRKIDKLCGV